MRIVVVYNRYLNRGGEDEVFEAEAQLLERHGHEVVAVSAPAENPDEAGPLGKARLAAGMVWSGGWYRRMRDLLDEQEPDLVHVHNVFPTMSPSLYHACRRSRVPVVQTLHNFRLVCPAATCFRNGRQCGACVGRRLPWPGVVHGCYHGSRPRTAAVAAMLVAHRALGTWVRDIDIYVALTGSARRVFVDGGLPPGRIVVKPNFVYPDPGVGAHQGGYALFVGRLSANKGVETLLAAWRRVGAGRSLVIVGDGPLGPAARSAEGVTWLGRQPRDRVLALMQDAAFLVSPPTWPEPFGLTVIEAYATGLPVVGSRIGGLAEIIEPGCTGLLFAPGDAEALAATLVWAFAHPREMAGMGRRARLEFEARYTEARNYELLMSAYRLARERAGGQA